VSGAPFVTRFAPSPTGFLHRGHAFSALTAFEAAHAACGRFLLRIEDIDIGRCRPEFTSAIFEDLAWLGLSWETPVRHQSDHRAAYARALESLKARGLVYRCFKTRRDVLDEIALAPHGPTGAVVSAPLEPREEARNLAEGQPFSWRLSIAAAERALGGFETLTFSDRDRGEVRADPWLTGDVVLSRKDIGVAYHLAVVVDDAAQGVTEVVRGLDLLEATHVQRLLQALLGLPTPAYRHHPLILRLDGKRFAKRDSAETLRSLRGAGVTPHGLRAELGV
jgi:glutamyl-Q tRNA(Asp) synthetase